MERVRKVVGIVFPCRSKWHVNEDVLVELYWDADGAFEFIILVVFFVSNVDTKCTPPNFLFTKLRNGRTCFERFLLYIPKVKLFTYPIVDPLCINPLTLVKVVSEVTSRVLHSW